MIQFQTTTTVTQGREVADRVEVVLRSNCMGVVVVVVTIAVFEHLLRPSR